MSKNKRMKEQLLEMEALLTPEQRESLLIEERIRQRIKDRYDQRSSYFSHLASFVIFGGIVWFLFGGLNGLLGTFPLVIMGFWLIGVAAHTVSFITCEARERAIQQEIERERSARYRYESRNNYKRKHDDGLYVLSEDGEIIPGAELYDDEHLSGSRYS